MGDEAIGAAGDILGCFTARTAVSKNVPARTLPFDVGGASALVLAIVPLGEVGLGNGVWPKTGKLAGSPGALARAGQHMSERDALKPRREATCGVFALGGQGNVGAACVLAGERPFGLAVPDNIEPSRAAGAHYISIAGLYSPRRAARLVSAR